jgi:glycosyltransferase involved in cell wall biosynthesis
MLLVTNTTRFPTSWTSGSGLRGDTRIVRTVDEFLQYRSHPECVILVHCDSSLTMKLAWRLWLNRTSPYFASVDLVLRRPKSPSSHVAVAVKRVLLKRVNHHVHFFRDVSGLREVYGIGAEKSSFVPFKSNLAVAADVDVARDGEYVLCFGRSMRDFDTFFSAMEQVPYPGAIVAPDFDSLRTHGSRFTRKLSDIPKNVRVLDEENVGPSPMPTNAQLRVLGGAKLVVLPILKSSIVASGISVCLSAMRLGRCVIGSEGPGMLDIFSDEVLTVPPEDPIALAKMIRRAWNDDELRRRTAAAGLEYAVQAGSEQDFYQRLVDRISDWYELQLGTSRTEERARCSDSELDDRSLLSRRGGRPQDCNLRTKPAVE